MDKTSLRGTLMHARQAMKAKEFAAKNKAISDKFMGAVVWTKIRKVHVYRSVPAWKETDTSVIAAKITKEYPEIIIDYASLDKGAPLPAEKYDLIIVPVLGFDADNYRLGLGGGWYDKFLATQPQAVKIGLGFQGGFIDEGLPREAHDIQLDRVITEV